jgi:hypothetical protein
MSWAADNPEAYDEILKAGIVRRLEKDLTDNGFDFDDSNELLSAVVESLAQAKDTRVYEALMHWSQAEISDAEADHWASLADSRE